MNCTKSSDCAIAGCVCLGGVCVNQQSAISNLRQCTECGDDSECSGVDKCVTNIKRCQACAESKLRPAIAQCVAVEENSNNDKDAICTSDKDCKNGCNCMKPKSRRSFCAKKSVIAGDKTCELMCGQTSNSAKCDECSEQLLNKAMKSCEQAVCVSTKFLVSHGLHGKAIRHFGSASVICIPGLPCGTPGHLLRECNEQVCKLVSYEQVCERRSDCVRTKMGVSQLKHSHDWSNYQVRTKHTTISLTSLSADASATSSIAPSRILAKLIDTMNHVGLGKLSDVLAALPHNIKDARNNLHFFAC